MAYQDSTEKQDRQLWQNMVDTVRPFSLSAANARLLVAVSGGADSLALLHLLRQNLAAEQLVVAHLNHGLRPEADDDAAFVAETAASWQLQSLVKKVAVTQIAKSHKLSLEAAGRMARYKFLAAQAAAVGAAAVITAHHADDQAETILLHLLRGSGSAGLRGMLPVSELPEGEGMLLVRPFLNISRAEIEAYCTRHLLAFRQDSSNEDVQFTRNRIRHELLPILQTYNPQISTHLQQLATITAAEYAALQAQFAQIWPELLVSQGKGWLVLDRHRWTAAAVAWQRLALRRVVQQLRPHVKEISFRTIELARELILEPQSGTEASLPGGLIMQVAAHEVSFGDASLARSASVPQLDVEQPVRLPVPGKIELANGWRISARPVSQVSLDAVLRNEDPWQAFVTVADTDLLWLRPFVSGERFQPLGMEGQSQAIQDLLRDRKVERGKRPLWPIIATSQHAVWIVGQHLDHRARLTTTPAPVVWLVCTPPSSPARD